MRRFTGIIAIWLAATGCAGAGKATGGATPPPSMMIGEFADDYGEQYSISAAAWVQLPRGRLRIVRWNVAEQYLVAQNDAANRNAPGRWTRVDWVALSGMAPYTWGFCYSAFDAPTAAAAESTHVVRRDTPRTGCNGFPFSRMKPRPA